MNNKENRYVIKFSKSGYAKYTSHLDMLRLFKRSFKKTGIALNYSQGFNPHPKMGFAQPLSLGYSSKCELIEFETIDNWETDEILSKMIPEMPEGIELLLCSKLSSNIKSLAADAEEAKYRIYIPVKSPLDKICALKEAYLNQDEILALKRQKKSKELKEVNIKSMIRKFDLMNVEKVVIIDTVLDCGSQSNCSPELVIASFLDFAKIDTPRYNIEVEREQLTFYNNLQF